MCLASLATQISECQLTFAQNAIYLRVFQHSQENEIDDKSFVRLPRQGLNIARKPLMRLHFRRFGG